MKRVIAVVSRFATLALLLPGCSQSSPPGWKVTPTGLTHADVAWCDSTHIAAQYFEGDFPQRPVVVTLDLNRPGQTARITLPDEAGGARELQLTGCEAGVLLLGGASASKPLNSAIYSLTPDGSPALLVSPKLMARARGRSRLVSLRGKLIAAPMPRVIANDTYAADEQCASYVRPGFKLLCFDSWFERLLALQRFVIVDYLWDDPVSAYGPNGGRVSVRNPAPRLYDKSGKPIVRATFLHDLDKRLIARLDEDVGFQLAPAGMTTDPQEAWIYVPCKQKNKSDAAMNDFDRVCRYRLDGLPNRWEELFVFALADKAHSAIQTLSVDLNGNVLFDMPGTTGSNGGIWRFNAVAKKVERIVATGEHEYVGRPIVSPDGRAVLFEQRNTWKLARQ